MKFRINLKLRKLFGFTIVEIMIVIAIAGLILATVAVGTSETEASRRDTERKSYARQVYEALEEYYKNNGSFPGCNEGCNTSAMQRFMSLYLPDGSDPSTGLSYHSTPIIVNPSDNSYYGGGSSVESADGASVYVDNGVWHAVKPKVGQIIIATAHWCYATTGNDPSAAGGSGGGPPLAGSAQNPKTGMWDQDFTKFAILIYQEHGQYYCLDDYAPSGSPYY